MAGNPARAQLGDAPGPLPIVELGDDLYRPGKCATGAVVLSPGRIEEGSGFELMVLGRTLESARAQADALAARPSS